MANASPDAQHQALLEVSEAIAQHRDLRELSMNSRHGFITSWNSITLSPDPA